MTSSYSDYIVYVDESGDHGLDNIKRDYPIFVLAFCIFKKSDYTSQVVPALQSFKFRFWGHDAVILHEHDIRKSMNGDYSILNDAAVRTVFLLRLNELIDAVPFQVIATVIRKDALLSRYTAPSNPYELSLLFCMERLKTFLTAQGVAPHATTHLVFESRGKQEDNALELEFRRICDNASRAVAPIANFKQMNFEIRFVDKRANSSGLQIADLVARPIGINVLRPEQTNRAFEIIQQKFYTKDSAYVGHGLKIFPT